MKKNENKKLNKNIDGLHKGVSVIVAAFFFIFIIIADIFLIASHDKSFSDTENRILQQKPAFSMDKITSGKFMSQYEKFISDQFPGRNNWIGTKHKMDKFLGKKESNGVIIGKGGYLFEETATPDEAALNASISSINSFAASHNDLKIVMSIVPNATEILSEYLPEGVPVRDEKADITDISAKLENNIIFSDLTDVLENGYDNEQLYYKSDHHWTSHAAYIAFKKIAKDLDITADASYEAYEVADGFSGTMASASGAFDISDDIYIYLSDPMPDYYVEYSDDSGKYPSIYDIDSLDEKNKYEIFFGGNHPKTVITTVNETGKSLLILKDSYANSFVQFLLPYYDTIVMIDPRYYSDDLKSEINRYSVTDTLILYNENTFVTDNSLAGVLSP